jgi:hypothetical protein
MTMQPSSQAPKVPAASQRTADNSADTDEQLVGQLSHPVAATVGAIAAGGATGAVLGTAVGPVGTAIGAMLGAVAGALGGDAIASSIDQAEDAEHWRHQHDSRADVVSGSSYDDDAPAYALGEMARRRRGDAGFDALDDALAEEWLAARGASRLQWHEVRPAAHDAWVWVADVRRVP